MGVFFSAVAEMWLLRKKLRQVHGALWLRAGSVGYTKTVNSLRPNKPLIQAWAKWPYWKSVSFSGSRQPDKRPPKAKLQFFPQLVQAGVYCLIVCSDFCGRLIWCRHLYFSLSTDYILYFVRKMSVLLFCLIFQKEGLRLCYGTIGICENGFISLRLCEFVGVDYFNDKISW